MAAIDIGLDRTLLNPNFDGYKLSLEALPIGDLALETSIDSPKLSSDLYSYQHVKLFGSGNKLFKDPWDDSVWFINSNWDVLRVQGINLSVPKSCYNIPNREEYQIKKNRFPVSLSFPDEDWMVICNGAGRLIILKTSNRKDEHVKCEECYNAEPLGNDKMFSLLHTAVCIREGKQYLEVVCAHIDIGNETEEGSRSITSLEWFTFNLVTGYKSELVRKRTLETACVPDCGVVADNGSTIIICSENVVKFTYDSLIPVSSKKDEKAREFQSTYSWTQKEREIHVRVKLEENIEASDVDYHLNCDDIKLKLKTADDYLLNGKLPHKVVVDHCTWTITDGLLLEIYLEKADDLAWNELVVDNKNGQLEFTDDQHAMFTSENEDERESRHVYNSQELEDCDYSQNYNVIHCFNGCTHEDELQVSLASHQWLFSNMLSKSNLPAICIRHDVDGLVYRLENVSQSPGIMWKHVATFNAFGYVQASKRQRKFTVCAPDFSYVAIVEVSKHVFIYHQPSESSVKSRKTKESLKVAKHQMVTLESNSAIEGAVATNNKLFILTGDILYCIRINTN